MSFSAPTGQLSVLPLGDLEQLEAADEPQFKTRFVTHNGQSCQASVPGAADIVRIAGPLAGGRCSTFSMDGTAQESP